VSRSSRHLPARSRASRRRWPHQPASSRYCPDPSGSVAGRSDGLDSRRTVCHGLLIRAHAHVVFGGLSSHSPTQDRIYVHVRRAGSRTRLSGKDRHAEESHLAQAILLQNASPVAAYGESDVLGRNTSKIDCRIVGVGGFAGRPGELRCRRQSRIIGPVGRILNGDVFGAQAHGCLQQSVVVPCPHVTELEDPVELILNPSRPCCAPGAQPHVCKLIGVHVIRQAGAVNRFLGPLIRLETGGGSDDRTPVNRISTGLGREAPDFTLKTVESGGAFTSSMRQ